MTGDESRLGFQRCPVSSRSSRLVGSNKCDSTFVGPQPAKFIQLPFFFNSLLHRQRPAAVEICFKHFLLHLLPPSSGFIGWTITPASTLPTSETTCSRFLAADLDHSVAAAGLEQRPLARQLGTTDGRSQKQNHNYQLERS